MAKAIRYEDGQLVETEPDEYGQYDVVANIQPRSEADAARLVACWNAHDDLHAACEATGDKYGKLLAGMDAEYAAYFTALGREIGLIRAALAKAAEGVDRG